MLYGKPCGRQLYDGEKCICHSEKEDKDVALFQRELDNIFGDEKAEYFDLTKFIFHKEGYKLPREYKKDTYFLVATFSGKARFYKATFSGKADFCAATFSRKASFSRVTFSGKADFRWATFSGTTRFDSTHFDKRVDFSFCRADKDARVIFDDEWPQEEKKKMFPVDAHFVWCNFSEPKNVTFRKVSLEKCEFLETDVTKVQFVDVTWARKHKFFKWSPRNAVYDELSPDREWTIWNDSEDKDEKSEPSKFQYELIAQLYRRLQTNYVNNYRYCEAGDFYIGEQEMMRKAKGSGWKVWRRVFCTNFLYKYISYYGESFLLPLFWLAFVLLSVPSVLLWDGINLHLDLQNPAVIETVNYEWSWSPGDFLPVNGDSRHDYWEAFVANFSLIAYSRSDIGKYLPELHTRFIVTIESLIVIALLAFFLLALRRQYKRKTF